MLALSKSTNIRRFWKPSFKKRWQDAILSRPAVDSDGETPTSERSKRTKAAEALSKRLRRALIEGVQDQEETTPSPIKVDENDQNWEEEQLEESAVTKKQPPAEIRCFDTARIHIRSGEGGNGCVAFLREKHMAKGGPSGGTGGRGGHVWAVADQNLNSLLGFRYKVHFRAGKGQSGKGSNLTGANGVDTFVAVPPGTVIRIQDAEDIPPLAELIKHGDKALLAAGGKGGRGNVDFKTPTNNAPTISEKGGPGEESWLELELKVVADVGIIGVPNAGKSTFLAAISAAKPKIADYPFTTLVPNLGVCDYDYQTTVFADVPGMLEGASKGIGLGHEFLRHCMRCRALIHIIDGTSPDPAGDYEAIQLELKLFSPELKSKAQIVCYNKTDITEARDRWTTTKDLLLEKGVAEEHLLSMSAAARQNTESVVRAVRNILRNLPPTVEAETDAMNLQKPLNSSSNAKIEDYSITVRKEVTPHVYIVEGHAIELFTSMTNWSYYEAYRRFQRVLDRSGISDSLRQSGIQDGDDVQIGDHVFMWSDDDSEQSIYQTFKNTRKAERRPVVGSTRWPHGS